MSNQSQSDNNAVIANAAFVVAVCALIAQIGAAYEPLLKDEVPSGKRIMFLIFFGLVVVLCATFIWRTGVFPKSLSVLFLVLGLAPLAFGFYSYVLFPPPPPPPGGPQVGPIQPSPEVLAQQEFAQGMRFYDSGEYQQACEKFNKAIDGRPNFFDAYKYLGLSYKALGDYDAAKVPLKEAYKLNSDAIRTEIADVYTRSIKRWNERGYKDKALRELMFLRDYDPEGAKRLARELGEAP